MPANLVPACPRRLTLFEIRFKHDTDDVERGRITSRELFRQAIDYLHLVLVFLLAVAVTAVHHDARGQVGLVEFFRHVLNVRRGVVRTRVGASKDHVAAVVTLQRTRGGPIPEAVRNTCPRKEVWPSMRTSVSTMAEMPCLVTERKT